MSYRQVLRLASLDSPQWSLAYRAIARQLLRQEIAGYASIRTLAPAHLQPHLLAMSWFVSATDDIVDLHSQPETRFAAWEADIRQGLAAGTSGNILLNACLNTLAVCEMPDSWVFSFLAGVRGDLDFRGISSEADFESYVEDVTLPTLQLIVGVHSGTRYEGYQEALRRLALAIQRADCLADLADDLRAQRCFLPAEELTRLRLTPEDLLGGSPSARVMPLLRQWTAKAHQELSAAYQTMPDLTPPELRPMLRAIIGSYQLRVAAVDRAGIEVFKRKVRPAIMPSLNILRRERRST